MARNEQLIKASPRVVFDVLADPRSYAYWVVGSIAIRDADPTWPAQGSRFHHTVGVGPLRFRDHTVVEDVDPGRFLQLETKVRPLGNARVKLELTPEQEGSATRVSMTEDPADKPTAFLFMPLSHLLLRLRNVSSLERLAELAEGRRPIPGDEPEADISGVEGSGAVQNPEVRERRRWLAPAAAALTAAAAAAAALLGIARKRR